MYSLSVYSVQIQQGTLLNNLYQLLRMQYHELKDTKKALKETLVACLVLRAESALQRTQKFMAY